MGLREAVLATLAGLTMCNLYSITTNQEAIRALFRVVNRYVGNLPPMPGVFPDYPAPVVRNAGGDREKCGGACRRRALADRGYLPLSLNRLHQVPIPDGSRHDQLRSRFPAVLDQRRSSDWSKPVH
jgi:hypothetical protein